MTPCPNAARTVAVLLVALTALASSALNTACAPLPADRSPAYLPAVEEPDVEETAPAVGGTALPRQGARVASPWRPGRPELGVQIYWDDNPADTPTLVRFKAERVIDYVVGLDANAVSISFPLFTSGPRANSVTAGPATPSPARLAILLDEIKRAHLRTTLRPILDEESLTAIDRLAWRGSIEPADRNAWFDSYRSLLTPYLVLADRTRVETVVLGTELTSLETDLRWLALATYVRGVYRGETAYAFNWDVFMHTPVEMPVQRIGVDAYPELKLGDEASLADVTAAWNEWLDQRRAGPLSKILIYEVGAAAQNGLYRRPARHPTKRSALNELLQERWFAASCQAAQDHEMAGLYWWKVDFHLDPAAADPLQDEHDSFVGRPAEQVIRSCFASWGAER
jgi:hypothetical protein